MRRWFRRYVDLGGFGGHGARAQHGPVERVGRESFEKLVVLPVFEVDGDTVSQIY